MTRISDFTAVGRQQLTLDDLLAAIEREEAEPTEDPGRNGQHDCDVEALCHAKHGVNGGGDFVYICGFRVAGTASGCPRRRRLEMHSGTLDT